MVAVAKKSKSTSVLDGSKLKSARILRGLTQVQLAAAIGVHPISISQYERGVIEPSLAAARRLAMALGVPIEELLVAPSSE